MVRARIISHVRVAYPLVTERVNTQFRAEFFNATNHTNFAQGARVTGLSTSLNSTAYDQILNARDPRNIQLALKVNF